MDALPRFKFFFSFSSFLCFSNSETEALGLGVEAATAGGNVGDATAEVVADTVGVELGDADGLIGTVLIGSSWRAMDFFCPNVFGLLEFAALSSGETEGKIVAVDVGEEVAVGVGLGLTDGDGAPVNLAAASAMHAQRVQNFFILCLDIDLSLLFERNKLAVALLALSRRGRWRSRRRYRRCRSERNRLSLGATPTLHIGVKR